MRSLGWRGRPDPAPSRLAWRIERWMLTPAIRLMLRAGLPFLITLGLGTWWLSDEARVARISDMVAETRASIEARPEFQVNLMVVDGAGDDVAAEIRDILPIEFPISSFGLDLAHLRGTIEALDPVRTATVRLRPGGVLEVYVEERVPVAIWRDYETLTLIDATGTHVADLPTRLARPDLPLIAGDGAAEAVVDALTLFEVAEPLGARLRGLVRVSERRWDVVLDRGQRILLPETGAMQALERVIALDQVQDLFARDVARIDMRLSARPTVQLQSGATEEWWRIQANESAPRDN